MNVAFVLSFIVLFGIVLEHVECRKKACNETLRDQDQVLYKKKNYYVVKTPMTWSDAVKHCNANCTALATITKEDERLYFYSRVSNQLDSKNPPWLGGRCVQNTDCRWNDTGKHVSTTGYQRWRPEKEPDTIHGRYQCMRLSGDDDDLWVLGKCENKRPFGCQYFTKEGEE